MKIYAAAVYTNRYMPGQRLFNDLNEREKEIPPNIQNILESYHYIKGQKYVDEIRADGGKVFLDSGAFSAFTLGKEISVQEYCNYIHTNKDIIRVDDGVLMAAGLDSIGDALKTFQNLDLMNRYGVKGIPCFHAGEDERYLEYYVQNYEYISLGGMVGGSQLQLRNWLDRMWSKYLVDSSGKPRIKVHGFGITARILIESYPWYSVDSSSWIQGASFGFLITEEFRNITVSDKSNLAKTWGAHLSTFTKPEQEHILSLIEKAGFTFDRLASVYQSRAAYNLWSLGKIMDAVNEKGCSYNFLQIEELF